MLQRSLIWRSAAIGSAAGRNPVSTLDFAQIDRREVEVFNPLQSRSYSSMRSSISSGFCRWFTFGFFCGIRPDGDGELSKLEWRDVHFGDPRPSRNPARSLKDAATPLR